MRLTLRTLLAYMDDMLDPSDQEELGRKIEASPFATELIHRSRDAVRRLRLSAPEPLADESGDLHSGDRNLDANTAAEYLDSILSPDDVAEFERSCLEAGPNADMLLAEAVSCHHILTLVLGEPAEVDGDLRQRMYEIVKHSDPVATTQVRIESAHRTPELEKAAMPARAPRRPATDPDEAAVPDYMREAARIRRGEKRRIAMIVGAMLLGAAGMYLFMTRRAPVNPDGVAELGGEEAATSGVDVAERTGVEAAATGDAAPVGDPDSMAPPFTPEATAPEATAATESPASEPEASEPAVDEAATATPAPVEPAPTATVPDEGAAATEPAVVDATPPAAADAPFGELGAPVVGADAPPVAAETTPNVAPAMPEADSAAADVTAATADAAAPPALPGPTDQVVVEPPATTTAPPADPAAAPPTGVDEALAAAVGGPDTPGDAAMTEGPAVADAAGASTADAAAPDQPRQLGAYLGNQDLLLRFDPTAEAWLRLPPRSALAAGDRLLVLPTFRTHVVLGQDVNAFVGGGTEVTLTSGAQAAGDASADFGLAIPFGRVILNSGASGNRIALALGDETRVIALGPSSSLAIDVERRFVPGIDPQRDSYPLAITYFLTTGKAVWGDGAMGETAEGQATWTTVDGEDSTPESIAELPAWVNAEQLTGLDESARDVVEESLAAGQPVSISLQELTDPARRGKRIEVRGLAAKCATYVGEFEPLVKSLSDMLERPRWKERVDTLRQAVARDPASLEPVAQSFAVQRGEKSVDDLVELLLGFNSEDVGTTKEEVQNGALVRLINWLDDEDLSYRVLASYNVNEITGTTSLGGYRPEHLAQKRKGEIKFYWDRLEKGDLMPREWTATGWAPR